MTCTCGCCESGLVPFSAEIQNRPGLSAIEYRTGTFGSFRLAILERLAQTPELSALSTRLTDDYAVTIVELWAAVADILTFYQERVANESFLRTAVQRDSLLRLVRLIDYELAPAVSATAPLAFTLERGATASIPTGTRVQSVPAQGETPQKYETTAVVSADARMNALRIHGRPVAADPYDGTAATAAPDAAAQAAIAALAPRDHVALYNPAHLETLTVASVDRRDDDVVVNWAAAPSQAFDPAGAWKLGRSFRVFGFDAPEKTVAAVEQVPGNATTYALKAFKTDFRLVASDGGSGLQVSLDARYPGLKPGAHLLVVHVSGGSTNTYLCEIQKVTDKNVRRPSDGGTDVVTGTVTQVILDVRLDSGWDVRDIVLHELLGDELRFWPYAYPDRVTGEEVVVSGRRSGWTSVSTVDGDIDVAAIGEGRSVILTDATGTAYPATIAAASLLGSGITFGGDLASTLRVDATQGTPITAIVGSFDAATVGASATRELRVAIGSSPPQTISLADPTDIPGSLQDAIRNALPSSASFARVVTLDLGTAVAVVPGAPGDTIVFGPSASDATTVVALGLDPGNARYLDGVLSGPVTSLFGTAVHGQLRVAKGLEAPALYTVGLVHIGDVSDLQELYAANGLEAVPAADDRVAVLPPLPSIAPRVFVLLQLDADPPPDIDGASSRLLGNVSPAAQGETVHGEVLGDGDASQAFQRFTLKKTPASPAVLQVLVNGVAWAEVASLYAQAPNAPVYTTTLADDGSLTVIFGDGVMGARLPTGRQNVVATYRRGGGLAGRVRRGTLTSLLDRPTGVRAVGNPVAADGGSDAESLAGARAAAPGTVRTFGRAVSLRDFEDTMLTGGVVAKATASWAWDGRRRAIHLTVAGQAGGTFSVNGLTQLLATFAVERDPNQRLLIDNYSQLGIVVSASLAVDPNHVTATVLQAARATLEDSLSFDRRSFAEPVYVGAIYATLQDVDGVLGVDVDVLDINSTDATVRAEHGVDEALGQPQPRILALPARPGGSPGTVLPAEVLVLESSQDLTLTASGGIAV